MSALKRSVSVPVLLGLLTYFVLGQQLGIASSFQDGTDGEYVDLCHVYAVDIGLAEEALQELAQLPGNPSEEQQREFAEKFAGAERNFGEFSTEVGKEEVTNRLYPWSEDGPYVVASVGYTDEMMASRNHYDSMILAILVTPVPTDIAVGVEGNAEAQMSYAWESDKIQIKTTAQIDSRPWLVGLECQVRIGTLHPEIVGPEGIFEDRSQGPPVQFRIPIGQ